MLVRWHNSEMTLAKTWHISTLRKNRTFNFLRSYWRHQLALRPDVLMHPGVWSCKLWPNLLSACWLLLSSQCQTIPLKQIQFGLLWRVREVGLLLILAKQSIKKMYKSVIFAQFVLRFYIILFSCYMEKICYITIVFSYYI